MRFQAAILTCLLCAVACADGAKVASPAFDASAVAVASEALAAPDCPWGAGQCAWPGAGDLAAGLRVGGWKTGTGSSAKVVRSDLLSRFTMQGAAFLNEVTFSAMREGAQDGVLMVEVRTADAQKVDGGRVLARGRTMLRNARDGAFSDLRVPLRVVAPVTRLADGTDYWLRVWVQPSNAKSPAEVRLDVSSASLAGTALRTCTMSGAALAATCTTWVDAKPRQLAFKPAFEDVASPSCEDRIKNGLESGRDCGTACGKGCGLGAVCFEDGDCGRSGVCRPGSVGPGRSDVLCGDDRGGQQVTCSCQPKLDDGGLCAFDADCVSGMCQGFSGAATVPPRCVPATCRNGVRDPGEGDVDCGGPCAAKCAASKLCGASKDCDKGYLCGGDKKPFTCVPSKALGSTCRADWQCASGACVSKVCAPLGAPLARCDTKPDCDSGVCLGGRCGAPTYKDRVKNGTESDVDCGGTGAGFTACLGGKKCRTTSDCDAKRSLTCGDGVCGLGLDLACTKDVECLSGSCAKPAGATKATCQPTYENGDVAHCTDKRLDNDETDLDCGGIACAPCADKQKCLGASDCASGVCSTAGQCAPATCSDGVQNGAETAVDCGGTKCGKCGAGIAVPDAASCASGVRSDLGVCIAPTCFDGLQNGIETGKDCGGGYCVPCVDGTACKAAGDCASGVCNATMKRCAAPTASDRVKNGDETDADCGGTSGKKCAAKKACKASGDCAAPNVCAAGLCAPDTCANGALDKTKGELGTDCGGSCGPCGTGTTCTAATQCASSVCAKVGTATTKSCAAPAASDGLKNGDETDVDCGGVAGPGCAYASLCRLDRDCATDMVCQGGRCNFGACGNSTLSQGANDCGRMCASHCGEGTACRGQLDCVPGAECWPGQNGVLKCTKRRCTVGGVEYKPGEPNPLDSCQMCDPTTNGWVARPVGAACDDGNAATAADRCVATGAVMKCEGTSFVCAPGAAEKCLASKAPVADGRGCEVDEDCVVTGVDQQKRCENGRCEGASCRGTLAKAGTACGTSAGPCSAGGVCDGVNASCPAERALVGVVCRPAAGPCDEAETCVLGNLDCPPDALKAVGDGCVKHGEDGLCVSKAAALECISCQPGDRLEAGACVPCVAGEVSLGGTATSCVPGVVCAKNTAWSGTGKTCSPCPAGSTSAGGAVSACNWCTTTQKWNPTTKSCEACPTGMRSDGGDSKECRGINCLAGEYWNPTNGVCAMCPEGTTSPGGTVTECVHIEACGNAVVEGAEECDDGNISSGDGCTETCRRDWELKYSSDFNDGTLGGIVACKGCSGMGCPRNLNGAIAMHADWNLLCIPGATTSDDIDFKVEFDVISAGMFSSTGFDRLSIPQVTMNSGDYGSFCQVSSGTTRSEPLVDVDFPVGHYVIQKLSGVYSVRGPNGRISNSQICALGDGVFPLKFAADLPGRGLDMVVDNLRWYEIRTAICAPQVATSKFVETFSSSQLTDMTYCRGCSGLGCPTVLNGQMITVGDWSMLCGPRFGGNGFYYEFDWSPGSEYEQAIRLLSDSWNEYGFEIGRYGTGDWGCATYTPNAAAVAVPLSRTWSEPRSGSTRLRIGFDNGCGYFLSDSDGVICSYGVAAARTWPKPSLFFHAKTGTRGSQKISNLSFATW
ncbi:MAG: hypothetical protein RL199_444 [Pseudomonadota bacterium]|jgi:hypothetical protein